MRRFRVIRSAAAAVMLATSLLGCASGKSDCPPVQTWGPPPCQQQAPVVAAPVAPAQPQYIDRPVYVDRPVPGPLSERTSGDFVFPDVNLVVEREDTNFGGVSKFRVCTPEGKVLIGTVPIGPPPPLTKTITITGSGSGHYSTTLGAKPGGECHPATQPSTPAAP